MDIYDEDGALDQSKVLPRLEEILARTNHGLTRFQRNDLIELLDAVGEALPADHECVGQEEAEHIEAVANWERQWGDRFNPVHPDLIQHGTITGRIPPVATSDASADYDRDMMGPSL